MLSTRFLAILFICVIPMSALIQNGGTDPVQVVNLKPEVHVETINLPDEVTTKIITTHEDQYQRDQNQGDQNKRDQNQRDQNQRDQNQRDQNQRDQNQGDQNQGDQNQNNQQNKAQPDVDTDEEIYKSGPIGCFADTVNRDLPELAYIGQNSVTKCRKECNRRGFKFAGVQYHDWCFCGNSYGKFGPSTNCVLKCTANSNEICGGAWANNVYRAAQSARATEENRKNLRVGCFADTVNRDLPELAYIGMNSVFRCIAECKRRGFKYAGVQIHDYCYCGNSYGKFGKSSNCNLKCTGNIRQMCGGVLANNIYRAAETSSATESISKGRLVGCYKDTVNRDLPELAYIGLNSVFKCITECTKRGFKFAGVQYHDWCFCGNNHGKFDEANNCNLKCIANSEQICGGVWANNVYRAAETSASTEEIRKGQRVGCFKDTALHRDLPELAYIGQNSVFRCIAECKRRHFKYAGVQYHDYCYCGNSYGKFGKADNCDLKCTANIRQNCGGAWANNVYRTNN